MRQKITCPETAHIEEIEITESPIDGTILGVDRCSRFHAEGVVECDELCAQRINQRFDIRTRRDPELAESNAESNARSNE